MKALLLLLLLPGLAAADLRPRKSATKRGDVAFWIERRGTGEVPYASDEITYSVDFYWNHAGPAGHTEETTRVSQLIGGVDWLTDLAEMRAGERRYVWGHMQDGNHCDHFGCSKGPEPYTAVVELVRVTPHHDAMPGSMRIAAHPLRVVDGDTSAPLPSDSVQYIDRIAVDGDVVSLHLQLNPYGGRRSLAPGTRVVSFTVAQLRARLAHARGVAAIRALDLETAKVHLDEALAIDANLDEARAHRAAISDDASDLAVLAKRNPVWLAWFVRSDPFARPLTKQLPAPLAGKVELSDHLVVHVEPTNRWIGVGVVPGNDGHVMRICDRATGALVTSIPLDKRGIRALVALGFRPAPITLRRDDDLETTLLDGLAIARWRRDNVSEVRVIRVPSL